MSLDKQIKDIAEEQLDELTKSAHIAIQKITQGTPLGVQDIARLVSGHKTKTTRDRCSKELAEKIGAAMLASLGNKEPASE